MGNSSVSTVGATSSPVNSNAVGIWQDWTPTLTATTTNPTLSNNSTHVYEGRYCRIGNTVFFRGQIRAGTAGVDAGSGTYCIALPVTARVPSTAPTSGGWMIGQFAYFDASTTTNYGGGILGDFNGVSGDIANMAFADSAGTAVASVLVDHDTPFALGASDEFELWGSYEAA